MGDRHWPEDATDAVEELESENASLRAEIGRLEDVLKDCLVEARRSLDLISIPHPSRAKIRSIVAMAWSAIGAFAGDSDE